MFHRTEIIRDGKRVVQYTLDERDAARINAGAKLNAMMMKDGASVPLEFDEPDADIDIYMQNVKAVTFSKSLVAVNAIFVRCGIQVQDSRLEAPVLNLEGGAAVMGDLHVAEVYNEGVSIT